MNVTKKTPEQVKKIVDAYLNVKGIHKFPVVNISHEIVSTYDGDYPSFIIDYDATSKVEDEEIWDNLITGIKNYTNLKHKQDYWLGIRWTWNKN
jgi:hypothetical protein